MFRNRLQVELDARRARNPRYSLRAFARTLGIEHSSLSQILRARRRLTARTIRLLGRRLGLSSAEIAECCAYENEEAIVKLIARRPFRADTRWIASRLGIRIDAVNIALQTLLRMRRVTFHSMDFWEAE
jgi:transcriptional regulator with XRE-family HTH domain